MDASPDENAIGDLRAGFEGQREGEGIGEEIELTKAREETKGIEGGRRVGGESVEVGVPMEDLGFRGMETEDFVGIMEVRREAERGDLGEGD